MGEAELSYLVLAIILALIAGCGIWAYVRRRLAPRAVVADNGYCVKLGGTGDRLHLASCPYARGFASKLKWSWHSTREGALAASPRALPCGICELAKPSARPRPPR